MGESKNNSILENELKERLKWYTTRATEEELDEKAVGSILYLLDHTDPLEEDISHSPEDAWKRFQGIVENQRELLALPKDKLPQNPCVPDEKMEDNKTDDRKLDDKKQENRKSVKGKVRKFVKNRRIFVAASLLLLILVVSGTIQVWV